MSNAGIPFAGTPLRITAAIFSGGSSATKAWMEGARSVPAPSPAWHSTQRVSNDVIPGLCGSCAMAAAANKINPESLRTSPS